jgi:hypothetical protein
MFTLSLEGQTREENAPLNEAQRALVEKKFDILQQASFGFTEDRLLHIQEEIVRRWTDECTDEFRRKIAAAAPSHINIALIDFRELRCVSLQYLPRKGALTGARVRRGPLAPTRRRARSEARRESRMRGPTEGYAHDVFRRTTDRSSAAHRLG